VTRGDRVRILGSLVEITGTVFSAADDRITVLEDGPVGGSLTLRRDRAQARKTDAWRFGGLPVRVEVLPPAGFSERLAALAALKRD
jgi:hypothetical protein